MLYLCFPHLQTGNPRSNWVAASLAIVVLSISGCNAVPNSEAQTQSDRPNNPDAPIPVETAVAATGSLETPIEYTGTTAPIREVSLRSQTEGRLLNLTIDVGDRVNQGAVIGQVDSQLLVAQVNQERSELAALQSEVAQAQAEVSNAKAQVEQARVELQQAQADAARLQSLVEEGAITTQAAEQAVTEARTAEQTLRSAQEQVRTQQQAVIATQQRVAAQRATLAEVQARAAYASLTAPISGAVLEKVAEPGDLLQPGDEVMQLGDFSAVKVVVQVSELELGNLQVGQSAQVRLDAFANQTWNGEILRISPAADPTARLIPIEISIPNVDQRISSGLLARVQFSTSQADRVIVPESALSVSGEKSETTLFVIEGTDAAKAVARSVTIGRTQNGQVEIRSGLQPGDAYIVRSSRPLKQGQAVKLSILSETS